MPKIQDRTLRKHVWKFQTGDVLMHRNGGYYRVVGRAFAEADVSPVYVYERNGVMWTRPQSEFEDGRFRSTE